ncbi:hypothetical protein [Chachezhania sediminis]|uniref:hypothetical protein n=1 Tax=Chachezhania sediminis TaxID=2599291 RepID=UPI00131E7953|nr:hypothetical protein [Chachezhania sediminis]
MTTTTVDEIDLLDDVIGNRNRSAGRQPLQSMARQVRDAFPVYDSAPDLVASEEEVRGEGAAWTTKDGFHFREAPPSASDHHIANAAAVLVKLYARSSTGTVLDLRALGAPDDLVTDISDIIDTAMATDFDLAFPQKFATSRAAQFYGARRNFHLPWQSRLMKDQDFVPDTPSRRANPDLSSARALSSGEFLWRGS